MVQSSSLRASTSTRVRLTSPSRTSSSAPTTAWFVSKFRPSRAEGPDYSLDHVLQWRSETSCRAPATSSRSSRTTRTTATPARTGRTRTGRMLQVGDITRCVMAILACPLSLGSLTVPFLLCFLFCRRSPVGAARVQVGTARRACTRISRTRVLATSRSSSGDTLS